MAPEASHLPPKRIVVCSDGTWMDSDGDVQVPSNVTRMCRCIKQTGMVNGTSIPQIVYYHSGVGSSSNLYSRLIGGATGAGISENIREAYSFICLNYSPGDEIFLVGFSRGAFTARSIAALIRAVGLLTTAGLVYFYQIFEDWQFQLKDGWTTSYPTEPWPHRPAIHKPEYRRKLLEMELTRADIPIKAVAVWDTVGALGIPMIWLFPQPFTKDYAFVNSKVEPNIEYAFQALALDEHRRSYRPSLWEKPHGQEWPRVLKQCWFPGVHSDIGGSYLDADLANLTLAWMISQLDPLLDFDHAYIAKQNRLSIERREQLGQPMREWGLGKIHDSMTLFFMLGGSLKRTPSEYYEVDAYDHARSTRRRLENTNEVVHSSVRIRMGRKGFGYNDTGFYDSQALQGWTMTGTEVQGQSSDDTTNGQTQYSNSPEDYANGGVVSTPLLESQELPPGLVSRSTNASSSKMRNVRWIKPIPDDHKTPELVMPEDEIGHVERLIMKSWPEIYEEFESIRPGQHASRVRKSSTFPNNHPTSGNVDAGESAKMEGFDGNHHGNPHRMVTI